jgi:hypothetical protein
VKEHPDNKRLKRKRNVAEFIYYTASEYGMDLVMENKDVSFDSWKPRKRFNQLRKNLVSTPPPPAKKQQQVILVEIVNGPPPAVSSSDNNMQQREKKHEQQHEEL